MASPLKGLTRAQIKARAAAKKGIADKGELLRTGDGFSEYAQPVKATKAAAKKAPAAAKKAATKKAPAAKRAPKSGVTKAASGTKARKATPKATKAKGDSQAIKNYKARLKTVKRK